MLPAAAQVIGARYLGRLPDSQGRAQKSSSCVRSNVRRTGGSAAGEGEKWKNGERPYLIARVALNRNFLLEAAVSVKSGSGGRI